MEIKNVGVVGAGVMGSGIAQIVALSGCDVTLVDVDEDRAAAGFEAINRRLLRQAEGRHLTGVELDEALGRLTTAADWADLGSLRDADVVFEVVAEDLEAKLGVFERLGEVCKPGALLASNTSSLPLSDLAAASGRADRVIGLHFFNPPWALKLVEVVTTASTSEETLADAMAVCERLGRDTVHVEDSPGFIANRLLVPFIFDAIQLLSAGVATAEDIDHACRIGLNHTMGPLATADLIGLDNLQTIAANMFDEYGETRFKAPTMLRRLVSLGHLGRKTGRGFFTYQ